MDEQASARGVIDRARERYRDAFDTYQTVGNAADELEAVVSMLMALSDQVSAVLRIVEANQQK